LSRSAEQLAETADRLRGAVQRYRVEQRVAVAATMEEW
jgi:hypothetical protein